MSIYRFECLIIVFVGETLVKPDKTWPDYTSMVGISDWRKDVDDSIKPNHTFRYYSALTIMASKLSYESLPFVQSVVNDRWKVNNITCLHTCK